MRFRSRLETLPGASAVAIGNFDGFHAGHRRIIETLTAAARAQRLTSVVLAFHPHPRIFFGRAIPLISTDRQRLELLKGQALDRLFFIEFAGIAACPAGDFVRDILLGTLHLQVLVVGEDFRFGRGREGNLEFLGREAAARDFSLIQAPGVEIDGCRVTSSVIRRKLAAGAIREANRMLEKPYFIDGTVERGEGRGAALGFPTMNIASNNAILPPGVFHTEVELHGRRHPAVTNIGSAPTFPAPARPLRVETHVPGFRRMVYGRRVRLHFIEKIRCERQFAAPGELAEQIRQDIAHLGI